MIHISVLRPSSSRRIFFRTYSTDNGSVGFRILINVMNAYSDRFIVSRFLLIWLLLYKLNGECCSCYYAVDVFVLVCNLVYRIRGLEEIYSEELNNLYTSSNVVTSRMRWA
jgi:hypothetical protein